MSQLGWVVGTLKISERLFGNLCNLWYHRTIAKHQKHQAPGSKSTSHKYEHLHFVWRKIDDLVRLFCKVFFHSKFNQGFLSLVKNLLGIVAPYFFLDEMWPFRAALVNLLLVFQRFTPAPILEMRHRKIWLMLMICCYFNRYKFNSMDISCYFLMTRDSQWKNWQKNMCVNGVFSENIRIQVWCWTI